MRVIACFLVLVVHSVEPFYLGGEGSQMQSGAEAAWAAVFLAAFSALFLGWLGTGADGRLGVWTAPAEILLTAVCSYVCTALCTVLIRKIPKVGQYIIG